MQFLKVNGELAQVVPAGPGRAKLVHPAGKAEDRLPEEVVFDREDGLRLFRGHRVVVEDSGILRVERLQDNLRHPLNPRQLVAKLAAKFFL